MSNLGNIMRKEIKELLTPATLVPIIIMALIFGSLGGAIGGSQDVLKQKPLVGIIDQDNSTISRFIYADLASQSQVIFHDNQSDVKVALQTVSGKGGVALLVIDPSFQANITANRSGTLQVFWIMKGTGLTDSLSTAPVEGMLAKTSKDTSKVLIDNHLTSNSTVILAPFKLTQSTDFKGKEMVGVSPGVISALMSSQGVVVPLIVVLVIIMAGSMVISSMGMEKENKTLETLLTLPVGRSSIVFGKLAGAAIVGLIVAGIYMVGLGYYMNSFTLNAPIDLAKFGLTLDIFDYALVGISLFLALVSALGICMILGIFTKNYKAAQSMTLPVTMLALIPMFVLMFADFDTLPLIGQVLVFAIPFSEPIIAMRSLMFDGFGIVIAGIIYQAAFALVTMYIAVRLFKKDILLTGRVRSAEKKGRMSFYLLRLGGRRK